MQNGLNAGEDINALSDRVKTELGSNRARALTIARTQTAGAISAGRQSAMTAAGVELKSWITSGDDLVRPAHKAAGIKYAAGIPVAQPFVVDDESLMQPGDPSGSAANIINCRCLAIARRAAGQTLGLDFYLQKTFITGPVKAGLTGV